jgi:hypothetical protein
MRIAKSGFPQPAVPSAIPGFGLGQVGRLRNDLISRGLHREAPPRPSRCNPAGGQRWFQPVNILGEHIVDHICTNRFLANLVGFFEGARQIVFEHSNCNGVVNFSPSVARASSVITAFGATDCTDNRLKYFLFWLPKLSNSNIVSHIEGRRRSIFSFGWSASTTESAAAAVSKYLNGPFEADKRMLCRVP